MSVAAEMVDELDITDQDVTRIADMIDGEISTLVPEWKKSFALDDENSHCSDTNTTSLCDKCASNGSPLMDYVTSDIPDAKNLQVLQCYKPGCAATHGRFEEITYQVEGSDQCLAEGKPELPSCQLNGIRYTDIWAQRDGPELSSEGSRDIYCNEADNFSNTPTSGKEERIITMDKQSKSNAGKFNSPAQHNSSPAPFEDRGNEIRQELRWLKAKYQMQLRELRDQQLRLNQKLSRIVLSPDRLERKEDNESSSMSSVSLQPLLSKENKTHALKSSSSFKHFVPNLVAEAEATKGSCSPEQIFTAKSFYSGDLLPQPLHRATSLPVDAIYF